MRSLPVLLSTDAASALNISPPPCPASQPLLKRYQAKRCSAAVFALPAVQAVIQFKQVSTTGWAAARLKQESRDCLQGACLRPTACLLGLSPFSNERRWNTYARRLLVIQGLWFLLW